jgi:hypothetical protein
LNKAKTLYRKKKPLGKYLGVVDQVAQSEYLVLFSSQRYMEMDSRGSETKK